MQFDVYDPLHPGWKSAIDAIGLDNSDVYFLPEYYLSWEQYEQSEAKCIVASQDGYIFAYPFLLNPIKGYNTPVQYYDIQSAYGYGGVITSHKDIPQNIVDTFNSKITEWLVQNKVIAEFIREHPLLNHIRRDAEYILVRKNIYIEADAEFRIPDLKTRQKISKIVRNNELLSIDDKNLDHLDAFIDLYYQNAERIGMSKYYSFPESYFEGVKKHLKNYSRLMHITLDGKIINSLLYFHYGNKGAFHLTGSDSEHYALRGNDYMYYSAIRLLAPMGVELVNFGGGTTANDDDNLFRYKKKFSNNIKDVYIGKKIIDTKAYDSIVEQWENKYPQLKEKYKNFFLKYRQTE